ncbi:iron(III) transport system permease protein [Roseovarius halotolerans]|uniref:Putative 2-aminoethylphosphonate transport system permease protein PhnU n=1 Tax=Roseovarius halotolerans TaxID=505353 RepID=A0A1X6ZIK3_9RHOB|nr:iron ABC transporter permease [Roseovarius halotolerans]RKT30983.1 iron(III) transport system permease protein [Roseovarius halotolerans]SLN51941.1 Putative 2-aminoethylphosphonate transport system permease protein PhnU [Roseovarius halotolerans]
MPSTNRSTPGVSAGIADRLPKWLVPNLSGLNMVALFIALLLIGLLLVPVAQVMIVAFQDPATGAATLQNFLDFFRTSLFRESFWNSFYVSAMSVVVATAIALPLAYITTRFHFAGSVLIQSLGFIPLIMPPFVGAVAMQLIFGRNGTVNLLLRDYLGFDIPFMEGLNGVILVQSIHYFPFILINLSASLRNIDRSMEEAAQNLGSHGMRLFRRIVFPLAMPGYIAGAALVFIKVFDDLGTPLLLNVNNMLAPQAYLRISSIGISDPMGYVISVILVVFSVLSLWASFLFMRGKDYATVQKGGGGMAKRNLKPAEKMLAYGVVIFILLLVLTPHIGLTLLSFGTIWSFAPLPDGYTLQNYVTMWEGSKSFIMNTLLYAGIAATADVILGTAIAYIVLRTNIFGRKGLDYLATAALAVPGVVLGIGYLRTFHSVDVPFVGEPLASWWVVIALALMIRRLPYALRACMAALQQVSLALEEAAESLGATKKRTIYKIVVPLMKGGLLAGFVTSFATAAVELSATIMLVSSNQDAPLAYGIYLFMQTPSGRGAGAALGVVAVLLVAAGTLASQVIIERDKKAKASADMH